MSTESREAWSASLVEKTPVEQAEYIIQKMIGYRSSSVYREIDVQNLATAIEALATKDESDKS